MANITMTTLKTHQNNMNSIVIIGASSGIGKEVAKILILKGWRVGLGCRRTKLLEDLKQINPLNVFCQYVDVTQESAQTDIETLLTQMGHIDCYLHIAGIGFQNNDLDINIEESIIRTNGEGFVRSITTAYNYFKQKSEGGHIAAVTSIAGTKGLGAAPAYSATKRMQSCYIQALAQKAHMQTCKITFSDIQPGFVHTALLDDTHHYPLQLNPANVAKSIINTIVHKKRRVVIDWKYSLVTVIWKMIPNYIWERLRIQN